MNGKPQHIDSFACVLHRSILDSCEREITELNFDGYGHVVDVRAHVRSDRDEVSLHLTFIDARIDYKAFVKSDLAAAMGFGFARSVFASNRGKMREVRGFNLSSFQPHDLLTAEAGERPVLSFNLPRRNLLPVVSYSRQHTEIIAPKNSQFFYG